MPNDGKSLESFVADIERKLGGRGLSVQTNRKVYNDNGAQLAEFDVEVRGRLGSTDIAWLIECRNRPSEGAAPVSWIEQLATRRGLHGFNKITAVSATGFSSGAEDVAARTGVELRQVRETTTKEFDWWAVENDGMTFLHHRSELRHASIELTPDTSTAIVAHFQSLRNFDWLRTSLLRASTNRNLMSLEEAFLEAASQASLFEKTTVNGPPYEVTLTTRYSDQAHYLIDTPAGVARVDHIVFYGLLWANESQHQVASAKQYEGLSEAPGNTIAQEVVFEVPGVAPGVKDLEFTIRRIEVDRGSPEGGALISVLSRSS